MIMQKMNKWQSTPERRKNETEELRKCLVLYICKNPDWGRRYIKKMEAMHGKDYAQKLRDEANSEISKMRQINS